jgi:hypothetical protein
VSLHSNGCGLVVSFEVFTYQRVYTPQHSPVLRGMFRFKPVSELVERYRSVVSCAMNMEDLISNCLKLIK